jgi:hypothetical protein
LKTPVWDISNTGIWYDEPADWVKREPPLLEAWHNSPGPRV